MSPEKTEICLEVLSAVVWADADLSIEEVAHAVDLMDLMEYADRHRIEEIFMMPRYLPPASKLQVLSVDEKRSLLSNAQRLARQFKGVAPEELALLRALHQVIGDLPPARLAQSSEKGASRPA